MVKTIENKKAWLKIAEAAIAIVIIASVLLIVYTKDTKKTDISDYIYELQNRILKEIALSENFRKEILEQTEPKVELNANSPIKKFAELNIPTNLNFTILVCNLTIPCNMEGLYIIKKDIFVEERIISSNLKKYAPKKVRLFIWEGKRAAPEIPPEPETCNDGTEYGYCSNTRMGKYCDNTGNLVKNCTKCPTCTTGYECNPITLECEKEPEETCSDGTEYGKCSITKPKQWYCNHTGSLVKNCTLCDCESGYECDDVTGKCEKEPEEEKIEVIFESGSTSYISATTLKNGNVLIAYSQSGGKFVIYDQDGNLVKSETEFESGNTKYISTTVLKNGNVLIAYSQSGGKFLIYNQNGDLVKGETEFEKSETRDISPASLNNGNVLIAYMDYTWFEGFFAIYDSLGNQIKSLTRFDAPVSQISATTLNNGNVLIAYRRYDGKFLIYNQNGDLVKSEIIFNDGNAFEISAANLKNGNVLIAYRDEIDKNKGKFLIYDQNGDLVKGETEFEDSSAWDISTTILNNGNVLIAYQDGGDNMGKFLIYDQNGNLVKPQTIFNDEHTDYISATALNNGNVLIAYKDNDNKGKFIIWNLKKESINQLPVAIATADPSTTKAGRWIQFSASDSYDPDGTIVSYFWDFKDEDPGWDQESNSTLENPTYKYNMPGTYDVELTVTDNQGATNTTSITIIAKPWWSY